MLRLANTQKQFKDVIEQVLEENELARDNDWILYGAVIKRLRGEEYMKNISLFDFLKEAAVDSSIPKITTPTRYRSLIQNEREELRGETYENRMAHSKERREEFRK